MPVLLKMMNIASRKPKSPMRLTTNALRPASALASLSSQKPMSRYEQRPTPSHPTNVTGKESPSTSTSIEPVNRLRNAKKRV